MSWNREINETLVAGDGSISVLAASGNKIADDPHSRIHQGKFFVTGYLVAALANDATIDIIMTTPANDYPHVVPIISLDGSCDFAIYEDSVFTGGTELTVSNQKRTSLNTFSGSLVHTPTISNVGTLIYNCHVSGGTGPHAGGSSGSFDYEWILKNSSNYLFRLTNRSAATSRASLCINFYSAPLLTDN